LKETTKSCDGDIDTCSTDVPSLRDKIASIVRAYCADVDCEIEDRCGNDNCECYGVADIAVDELVGEIMEIIENA